MNKKGFEVSFAWIFSIIVGAIILFLAVYATTQGIRIITILDETEQATQLGILLSPVGTNVESGKTAIITFPKETRFINSCNEFGNFGTQGIALSQKSFNDKWNQQSETVNYKNKYIFSEKIEEGKKLYLFVKPFKFPYKIADLVIATTEDYCFVNPDNDIEDQINSLNPKNINISDSVILCPETSITVCFSSNSCDVNVNTLTQEVEKDGRVMYYAKSSNGDDTLIFGAIFSDPSIYECQVKRLMKRNNEIAFLYGEKASFLDLRGCVTNLAPMLADYGRDGIINEGENSFKLKTISLLANDLKNENKKRNCKLF